MYLLRVVDLNVNVLHTSPERMEHVSLIQNAEESTVKIVLQEPPEEVTNVNQPLAEDQLATDVLMDLAESMEDVDQPNVLQDKEESMEDALELDHVHQE